MIVGTVSDDLPLIELPVGSERLTAVADTGLNGYRELPQSLFDQLNPELEGELVAELASGVRITEVVYRVRLEFDGDDVDAVVSFVEGDGVLLGTKMLLNHRLTVDFPTANVLIERLTPREGNSS